MSTFRDATPTDVAAIEAALGRPLAGRCAVVVRRSDGRPVVIENEPHLRDGTPMPTLYWLMDPEFVDAVSRLEGAGGVHQYEATLGLDAIAAVHEAYAARRQAAIVRLDAPAPAGGVGGTRVGIKCLHAHLANYLAGNDDLVGQLVTTLVALPPTVLEDVRS